MEHVTCGGGGVHPFANIHAPFGFHVICKHRNKLAETNVASGDAS